MLKTGIALRQSLNLSQQASLQILECSISELSERIQEELEINPFIELDEGNRVRSFYPEDGQLPDIPDTASSGTDILVSQIPYWMLTEDEIELLKFLFDLLERRTGYLRESVREICSLTGKEPSQVEKCVSILRGMEPVGIGAASFEDCIVTQLKARHQYSDEVLPLLNHLKEIAEDRTDRLPKITGMPVKKVKEWISLIKECDPFPGRFLYDEQTRYIIPDIAFACEAGRWKVAIPDRYGSGLKINPVYSQYRSELSSAKEKEYYSDMLSRARLMIFAIKRREATLYALGNAILEKQLPFISGQGPLKAFTMKEAAEQLGLNRSTLSRTVKDKYASTPKGTVPLKSFFVKAAGAGPRGNKEIKHIITELIRSEPRNSPLTDQMLATLLKAEGITISRRTAAKYRNELGIPIASRRRSDTE